MNRACPEFEPLLLDRAAGTLDPALAPGLSRHLSGCVACRAEAGDVERALALATLPSPSEAERETVARGARDALLRHRDGRNQRRLAGGLALAIAASAAFALAVPWFLLSRHATQPAPAPRNAPRTPAASAAGWELPDLDAAWEAAAVADPQSSPEAEPEMLFAELQEIDLDFE